VQAPTTPEVEQPQESSNEENEVPVETSDYEDEEEVVIEFEMPNQPTPATPTPTSSTPKAPAQQTAQTSLFPGWMRGRNK
jgi:hypothetical protein